MTKNKKKETEWGAEYSKLKKSIGSVDFKLKIPRNSYFVASLDFDDIDKPNKPTNWNFHVCTGNNENHDHYLLNKKQAEELYKVLGNFLKEYKKKFKKP